MRVVVPAAFVGLLLALPAARAQDEVNCDTVTNQPGLNDCAAQDLEAADKELNAAYRRVMAQLEKDAKGEAGDYAGLPELLKKTQRAWIVYRDGQCELSGYQAHGGQAEAMIVSGCAAELTRKRTEELKERLDE